VYQEQPTTSDDMRTRIRIVCILITLMQAEKAFQNSLDYVCTCGDVNLNITDKPENNDFI